GATRASVVPRTAAKRSARLVPVRAASAVSAADKVVMTPPRGSEHDTLGAPACPSLIQMPEAELWSHFKMGACRGNTLFLTPTTMREVLAEAALNYNIM